VKATMRGRVGVEGALFGFFLGGVWWCVWERAAQSHLHFFFSPFIYSRASRPLFNIIIIIIINSFLRQRLDCTCKINKSKSSQFIFIMIIMIIIFMIMIMIVFIIIIIMPIKKKGKIAKLICKLKLLVILRLVSKWGGKRKNI